MRNFCQKEFSDQGIDKEVKQANLSYNKSAYTLRGFHYQLEPFQESKTMTCVDGEIYDVVVDLRKESETYKKWISTILNPQNKLSIHVPKGCANAFLTMKTIPLYTIILQRYTLLIMKEALIIKIQNLILSGLFNLK